MEVGAVKEIIQLIAVDPAIAVVSRFHGLAADHLMHGSLSASSQVGEVLIITLLKDEGLSRQTWMKSKLQLIALAQARESQSRNVVHIASKKNIADMFTVVENMGATIPSQPLIRLRFADTVIPLTLKVRYVRGTQTVIEGTLRVLR